MQTTQKERQRIRAAIKEDDAFKAMKTNELRMKKDSFGFIELYFENGGELPKSLQSKFTTIKHAETAIFNYKRAKGLI